LKILLLTDLNWNLAAKQIGRDDILALYETNFVPTSEKFRKLRHYWHIVKKEAPELVLLGGDLTGDGSCGHGYHTAFFYLLCLLDLHVDQTYFIKGDNDLDKYYEQVTANLNNFSRVKEISNQRVQYRGLSILGIPYSTTRHKKQLKKLAADQSKKIDIILSHSELKRRSLLFGLPASHIITGHFDNKFCAINEQIFLSFSNDSAHINYGVMNWSKNIVYHYKFYNTRKRSEIVYSDNLASLMNGNRSSTISVDGIPINIKEFEKLQLPVSDYEKDKNALALAIKYLRGQNYKAAINFLRICASKKAFDKEDYRKLKKKYFTSKHKLSKSMILDFLGNKYRSYL